MTPKTNRRNFLKTSLMVGAGLFLPKSIALAKSNSSDDKRIIVIGAGLAGLSCAYELKQGGYNVLLLEASSNLQMANIIFAFHYS
jgi:heterodisulfide reductase subunit A-like polyferredoxin